MDERKTAPATEQELATMDAYWRAANYLSACQLYLLDDPLLQKPLTEESIKKKIVGHWGTVPGQNFIYTHLNRVIKKYDLDMIYVSGPGHGGNAMVAQDWLDGSYTEVYPNITRDKEGMQKLFKRFSQLIFKKSHASYHILKLCLAVLHCRTHELNKCNLSSNSFLGRNL